jgi:hypothetical protein
MFEFSFKFAEYSNLKVVPRGLIPSQKFVPQGMIPRRNLFRGGYDTPQEFVLLGIRPCRTRGSPLCSFYLSALSTPVSLSPLQSSVPLRPLQHSVPSTAQCFPSTALCPLNPFVPSTPLSPLRLCPLYSFVPSTLLSPLILCSLYGPLSRRQFQHRAY